MKDSSPITQTDPGLPNAYADFSRLSREGVALSKFGFHTTNAQVFRFANRFKVASSFSGVELRGYAEPTNRAYGALFRILLTCSAVEQYMTISALQWHQIEALLPDDRRLACLTAVRGVDREGRFFAAVRQRTRHQELARTIEECMNGQRNEVLPIVRAVRHGFAHGDLAPGANAAAPGVAQKLARFACPLLLGAIEQDFKRRVLAALVDPARR